MIHFQMNSFKKNSETISAKIPVNLVLFSSDRFEAIFNYNEEIINLIKSVKSSGYNCNTRRWNILLIHYKETVKLLNNLGNVELQCLPLPIFKMFNNKINGLPAPPNPISLVSNDDYLKIDPKIREVIFPFQIKGVKFMIGRNGRCLLADDMGLGKTIQSLGAASFYRDEWPLLVVSPSSVKIAWRDQIKKWISEPLEVHVISSAKDIKQDAYECLGRNSVVLISYDLVSKMSPHLLKKNFKVMIMDESHFIKSGMTARAKGCIPLAKKAKRVFLLSGTPALSRPSEMFTQIDIVTPALFNGYFKEFGTRYCDPKQTNWGVNYNGSSNTSELQIMLNEGIMLRRLKTEVLTELPEKRREVIILAPEFLEKASLKRHAEVMMKSNLKSLQRRGALLEYFCATGKAKIDAIKNYIDDLVESPRKFLFFAHHVDVLNAVEDQMIKKKIGYIRIDGSVSAEQKRIRTEKFQYDDSIQVAILSIVAAGTGITLTAATLVVFGELFWNPGILLQAENRCHRIGQKDFVNIHYLVAEKTADDYIWPLVQGKMELLSKVGLNKETFKDSETTRLEKSFSEKQDVSSTILNYFEKDFIEEVKIEEFIEEEKKNQEIEKLVKNESKIKNIKEKNKKEKIEEYFNGKIKNKTLFKENNVNEKVEECIKYEKKNPTEFEDSFDLEFLKEFDSIDENNQNAVSKDPSTSTKNKGNNGDINGEYVDDFDFDLLINDSDDGWMFPDLKKMKYT